MKGALARHFVAPHWCSLQSRTTLALLVWCPCGCPARDNKAKMSRDEFPRRALSMAVGPLFGAPKPPEKPLLVGKTASLPWTKESDSTILSVTYLRASTADSTDVHFLVEVFKSASQSLQQECQTLTHRQAEQGTLISQRRQRPALRDTMVEVMWIPCKCFSRGDESLAYRIKWI